VFFYASKIFWFFAAPSNLILILAVLGAAALVAGSMKWGRRLSLLSCFLFILAGPLPLGYALMRPLEDRFARPAQLPQSPAGIIVLGGGVDEIVSAYRRTSELTEAGERMTEAVALARRYPQARLVFTGGSASLSGRIEREADVAQKLFAELGIPAAQMLFESQSRNTHENAVLTKALVQPKAGEVWLLVTSAYHMPRAMGIFRQADFTVVPWPVDYATGRPGSEYRINYETGRGLRYTDRAVREWIGLFAYYVSGRSQALLPAPK
jgi:uncharacterized SAM-binding protein YcdF (DUF218 family)